MAAENLQKAIADLSEVVGTMGAVLEDGKLTAGDMVKLPALMTEFYHLFEDGKAAVESGEIKALTLDDAHALISSIFDLGAAIASQIKKQG